MTSEEYLEFERASLKDRHMLWRGEIFLMSGASRQHVKISGNIHRHIHVAFDGRECEVMQSDMRVKNHRSGSYFYPDVVATCESPKYEDDTCDTLLNPQVIIEVLSKSTESFDRGAKFKDYQSLESVREYVLVSQKQMHVERFTRTSDSTWEYWSAIDADSVLELNSIDCKIQLRDIYAKVEFPDLDVAGDLKVIEERVKYEMPQQE